MADKIIVLDNSINSRLLWPDNEKPENNDYALKTIQQAKRNVVFHVPTIWHYEMAQVAYKLTKSGETTQADVQHYFNLIALLPIVTDSQSHVNTSATTYALSLQYKLSIYDAAYLELALRLGVALATNDNNLIKAAEKTGGTLFSR